MPKRAEGAWAHAIVARHWGPLLAVAGAPERMPTAQEPAPGRRGAPRRIALHGCGHYGCVAPTGDAGVVFKITSDPDEAGFVAAALSEPDQPAGVVAYYAVAELEQRRRGRPVYAVWREAAHNVGAVLLPYGPTSRAFHALRRFRIATRALRAAAKRAADRAAFLSDSLSQARSMVQQYRLTYGQIETDGGLAAAISSRRGVARGAVAFAAAEMNAQALSRTEGVYDVGEALLEWIGRGILVCDVHPGNLGNVVRRGVRATVITDPGQSLLLDDSHAGVRVPELASTAGSTRRFP